MCLPYSTSRRAKSYDENLRPRPPCNSNQAQHAWSCKTSVIAERDRIPEINLLVISLTLEHDVS
jgi:hypothetical protein